MEKRSKNSNCKACNVNIALPVSESRPATKVGEIAKDAIDTPPTASRSRRRQQSDTVIPATTVQQPAAPVTAKAAASVVAAKLAATPAATAKATAPTPSSTSPAATPASTPTSTTKPIPAEVASAVKKSPSESTKSITLSTQISELCKKIEGLPKNFEFSNVTDHFEYFGHNKNLVDLYIINLGKNLQTAQLAQLSNKPSLSLIEEMAKNFGIPNANITADNAKDKIGEVMDKIIELQVKINGSKVRLLLQNRSFTKNGLDDATELEGS